MKTKFLFYVLFIILVITKSIAQNYSAPGTNNVGNNNTFVGFNSGLSNTSNSNSAFGAFSLSSNTGGSNSAFGLFSLRNNLGGTLNCSFGAQSMQNNTTGSQNVAFGYRALEGNTTGTNNTAIGYAALLANNNSGNIAVGLFTPRNFTTGGNENIFIGNETAKNLLTGNNNTILGRVNFDVNPSTTTTSGNNTSSTIILADGNANQRFFVHSNGYAGIGLGNNAIPQNRLELNGGLVGTSGLRFRSYNSSTTPVASNGRVLTLNALGDVVLTTDVGSGGATIISNGINTTVTGTGVTATPYQINAQNIYTNDGTLGGNRTVTMNNNSMIFNTSTNGRIYIGNTSPAFNATSFPTTTGNYRLYIEGGILTEKVKVALRSTTNWADYVFAKDYKLTPLQEVETFVKANKHLQGIESANDLLKNGLDLAEMQAKQMAKIEELTLYAIEQNKQLEKQSKELEELKAQVKVLLEKK